MNVCFILSDPSLHNWAFKTQFFLFNCWDLIWAVLCVLEIPRLCHFLGSQPNFPWLLFGILTLADWAFLFFIYLFIFFLCIFKTFSLHGSLDLNSLGFSFILLFFLFLFFLHYTIAQCVIFLWALGYGQFWTSTMCIASQVQPPSMGLSYTWCNS